MSYFEYHLPDAAPYWLHPAVQANFNETIKNISRRMDKLELACSYTAMVPDTFAMYAKTLFDTDPQRFDQLIPEVIAEKVSNDYEFFKKEAEPRLHWPNAEVIIDTAFVTRKEWESLRMIGIGGSEGAIVRGISPYSTQADLYHRKVGTPQVKPDKKASVFERGHQLEDRVINAFLKLVHGIRIPETRMFRSKTHPLSTANIDAIIKIGDNLFVFEAKTTIAENYPAWAGGRIPAQYVPQMIQYPGVLNDPRIKGTFIGCLMTVDYETAGYYIGSSIIKEDKLPFRYVKRDLQAEENLFKEEEQWYETYVMTNTLPPYQSNPKLELETIQKFTANACPENPIQLWNLSEYDNQIQEYFRLSEEMDVLKKKLDEIEDQRKTISLEMIEELGANVEANIELGNNEYYEIKYAPRCTTVVDKENLNHIIQATAAYLPDALQSALQDCIHFNVEQFRSFSIKKKVHVEKRKKTKKVK